MHLKLLRTVPSMIAALLLSISLTPALSAQITTGRKHANSDIENIGKRDINKGASNFMSLQHEAEIGRQAAAQLERRETLLDDAQINKYIDDLTQNIAENSDSKFPITIKIIDSSEVNAVSILGGYIYIYAGAIQAVDNEAELAFIIAQLVGHVAERDEARSNSKATLMQIASIPAITMTGGVAGTSIQQSAQSPYGTPISLFKFSQDSVKEADFLGLEYLYKAGYEPDAAVSFLRKVEALEMAGPKQSSILRTIPPAAERIQLMEKNIKIVIPGRTGNILNTPGFDAIKARVSMLQIEEGVPSGNPSPSMKKQPR